MVLEPIALAILSNLSRSGGGIDGGGIGGVSGGRPMRNGEMLIN